MRTDSPNNMHASPAAAACTQINQNLSEQLAEAPLVTSHTSEQSEQQQQTPL